MDTLYVKQIAALLGSATSLILVITATFTNDWNVYKPVSGETTYHYGLFVHCDDTRCFYSDHSAQGVGGQFTAVVILMVLSLVSTLYSTLMCYLGIRNSSKNAMRISGVLLIFAGLLVFVALMIYLRTVLSSKTKIPIESAFGYSFILASFACAVAVLTGLTSYSTSFVSPSRLGVPRHHTSSGTVNHSTAAARPQLPK